MTEVLNFRQQIRRNQLRSWFAILILCSIWLILGGSIGYFIGWLQTDSTAFTPNLREIVAHPGSKTTQGLVLGLLFGGIIAVVLVLTTWLRSESVATAMVQAHQAPPEVARRVYNVIEELLLVAKIDRPSIYLIEDSSMNACAIQHHNHPGRICVTRGLVENLDRDQLAGVLAHELAHLRNEDAVFSTFTATMFGGIYYCSEASRSMIESAFWWSLGSNEMYQDPPLVFRLIPPPLRIIPGVSGWIFFSCLSVIAYLVVLFASRSREWMADMSAVEMTRNPMALAKALETITATQKFPRRISKGAQHLLFVNPFSAGEHMMNLFSTHPPIEQRIQMLKKMAGAKG